VIERGEKSALLLSPVLFRGWTLSATLRYAFLPGLEIHAVSFQVAWVTAYRLPPRRTAVLAAFAAPRAVQTGHSASFESLVFVIFSNTKSFPGNLPAMLIAGGPGKLLQGFLRTN
jgi:hypothetical protein